METRIQYIFLELKKFSLVSLCLFVMTGIFVMPVVAAEQGLDPEGEQQDVIIQETVEWDEAAKLVEPEIKRTKVDVADIDAIDFEIGAFFGMMNVEDFGTNTVSGISFAYHVTEDIFVSVAVGQSTTGQTSFEDITGARLLTDSERDLLYYDLSLGYNLLPGEGFIGESYAFNSVFYIVAGIGATEFAGDQRSTISGGAGYKIIMMDWLALHIEVKDYVFDIDILGTDKTTHNINYNIGFSIFF